MGARLGVVKDEVEIAAGRSDPQLAKSVLPDQSNYRKVKSQVAGIFRIACMGSTRVGDSHRMARFEHRGCKRTACCWLWWLVRDVVDLREKLEIVVEQSRAWPRASYL